jgi:hypothetical protein
MTLPLAQAPTTIGAGQQQQANNKEHHFLEDMQNILFKRGRLQPVATGK